MNQKNLFLSVLFFFISTVLFAQTKHALIVAIGNYPDPAKNKWKVINSVNDIPLIKNALVMNQRFEEKNVQLLVDAQATRQGIIDALDKLYKSVNNGDIVVVHFSSHGQQLEDDNGDEIDGLDEAIVPYGAAFSRNPDKYKELQAGYLRDDIFGDKITQIRNKLGKDGDILVILDACHSGSGTRDAQTTEIRGGNEMMTSSNFSNTKFSGKDTAGVFNENEGTKLSADAATLVLISGAQAKESNFECFDDNDKPVGSLSYAFSKAISALKGNITYRGLFAQIESIMLDKAPKQKPVLEGDAIDRELFGGKYVKQQPYFSIIPAQSNAEQIGLNGGFVSGITAGSVIKFYKTGTTSTAGQTPVGTGKVTSSSSFSSVVQLDKPDSMLARTNPWAFVNELAYGTQKVKLMVPGNKDVAKLVQDSLKHFQLIEFSKNFDLFLDTSGTATNWALKYPNSGEVFVDGFSFTPGTNMNALREALKRFDRFRYLKGLSFAEPGLSAQVDLVFLDGKNIDSAKIRSRTNMGRLELQVGDEVYLRIANTGDVDFFVNIVDIQPDGIINAIMPNKKVKNRLGNPSPVKWEDCQVPASKTRVFDNLAIKIGKPYGEEIFKVFISRSALDLEDILTSKNEQEAIGKRGVLNGLEKIFVDSNVNEVGKRGGEVTNVSTDQNGTIFSVNFQIVPKK